MLKIAFGLGLIAVVYRIWQKQPVGKGLGLSFNRWLFADFRAGVLITLIAMAGIFAVEWLLGGITVIGFPFDWQSTGNHAGYYLFGAFFEEFIFRVLMLSGLVVLFREWKWPAILLTSVAFAYIHLKNPEASYVAAFGNGLGGIMYGIAFLGSRNIWLPAGLHFGWNFFQGPLFGFPVSGTLRTGMMTLEESGSDLLTGGAYGPEAGLVGMLFRFVVIGLVLYYLTLRSGGKGDLLKLDFPLSESERLPESGGESTKNETE